MTGDKNGYLLIIKELILSKVIMLKCKHLITESQTKWAKLNST